MSTFFLTSSGDTPTAKEHRPSPNSPTCRWPSSLVVAPQIGGWGCCSGLGWTRRRGICQYLPSKAYSSLVQQPTMCSIASRHIWRVSDGSVSYTHLTLPTNREV